MRHIHRCALRLLSAALIGISLAASLPAQAVGVFQNDAGSSGDAGDIMQQALAITQGYHTAELAVTGDPVDWYQIPLNKGDKLRVQLSDYSVLGLKSVVMQLLSPAGQAITLEPEGLMAAGSSYSGKVAEIIVHETGTWYLKAEPVRDGVTPGDYAFRLTVTPGFGTVINTRNQSWIVLELYADEPTELLLQARMHGSLNWDRAYWGTMSTERELDGRNPDGFGFNVIGSGRGTSTSVTPLGVEGFDVISPVIEDIEISGSTNASWSRQSGVQGYVRYIVALSQDDPWISLGVWADRPVTWLHSQGNDNVEWSESSSGADFALVTPGVSMIGERELQIDLGTGFRGNFSLGNAQSAAAYRPDGSLAPLHASCDCVSFRPSKYLGFTQDSLPGTWRFELGESLSGPYRSPYLVGVRVMYPGLF